MFVKSFTFVNRDNDTFRLKQDEKIFLCWHYHDGLSKRADIPHDHKQIIIKFFDTCGKNKLKITRQENSASLIDLNGKWQAFGSRTSRFIANILVELAKKYGEDKEFYIGIYLDNKTQCKLKGCPHTPTFAWHVKKDRHMLCIDKTRNPLRVKEALENGQTVCVVYNAEMTNEHKYEVKNIINPAHFYNGSTEIIIETTEVGYLFFDNNIFEIEWQK